jgi:RNA polymerase sigma factor (sigma-70 family)
VGDLTNTLTIAATSVADAAAGDVEALARIVRAHHDDMARVCFVICGDRDAAQDAVQAAWPIVIEKLATLRDPGRLRPWLVSIAANQARQSMRRRQHGPVVEAIDTFEAGSSATDPAGNADLIDLAAALRRLSPDDRALLSLRFVAGFDATELGRALGMSPSGIRSRLARLIARLRTELDDD